MLVKFYFPDLSFHMSPEVAGHVGVHVAKAVEGAKGQVKQKAPHKGEVAPYLIIGRATKFSKSVFRFQGKCI